MGRSLWLAVSASFLFAGTVSVMNSRGVVKSACVVALPTMVTRIFKCLLHSVYGATGL